MLLERVKTLLNQHSMTIAELERKMDFSQGSIGKWNKQSPSAERLQKVADYFNVSTDYLLGRTNNLNGGISNDKKMITVEDALASVMSSDGQPLTENDRAILAGIIEAYIEKSKNK